METKFFNDGFVGKKVTDANEAIKLFNAGMDIRSQNGYDFLWWDDDDSEPSSSEIVSRIIFSVKVHGYVYAGFELTNEKVVPIKSTQLDCDFYVDQDVYYLYNNKISHGKITSICLATDGLFSRVCLDNLKLIRQRIESVSQYAHDVITTLNIINDMEHLLVRNVVRIKETNGIIYKPLVDIFATKEALVENLLSNSNK